MYSGYLSCHPEYEFNLINKGQGLYYIAGNIYHFGPKQLLTILPGQTHAYIACGVNVPIEKATILFKGRWLKHLPALSVIDKTFPPLISLSGKKYGAMETTIRRIDKVSQHHKPGWEEMIRKLLRELLTIVAKQKNTALKPQARNPLFIQLCQYISSHFTDPQCNATEIARKFGYSLCYLSTFFKKEGGIGLKQYMIQSKISAAHEILAQNPNIKIEVIASQVGFNQYRQFVREFIRLTGASPSEYRKKYHIHLKK